MLTLAFLNLGPAEVLVLLTLILLFFGADRLPQLARSLGKAKGELERARVQFARAIEDEESRMLREQLAFESRREHQMQQQALPDTVEPESDEASLRKAALALGIAPGELGAEELRAAIREKVERTP